MKYFTIFSNCIPVKGYRRAVIYDLQTLEQYYIPNTLYEIINKKRTIDLENIINKLDIAEIKIFNNYIDFLNAKNLGHFCSNEDVKLYPNLNLCWYYPSIISNAIIEIKNIYILDYKTLITEIEQLGCKHLQIQFTETVNESDVEILATYLNGTRILTVELLLQYNEEHKWIPKIIENHKRIIRIIVYNAPEKIVYIENTNNIPLSYMPLQMNFKKDCGKIGSHYFSNNMTLFTESQHYNTCLNRKISIGVDGVIKNCPVMEISYGNVKTTSLRDAINKSGFKNLWGIRKDDVDVCKDCEFRYMCTDCRCFIKNPDDIYSQPAKCLYNPYIAKWSNEDGYISVEEWRFNNPNWEKKAKRKPLVKVPQKVE